MSHACRVWLFALVTLLAAGRLPAQTNDLTRRQLNTFENRQLVQTLAEPINLRGFRGARTLKETLTRLMEKLAERGTDLPILLDAEAFQDAGGKGFVFDLPIRLPAKSVLKIYFSCSDIRDK